MLYQLSYSRLMGANVVRPHVPSYTRGVLKDLFTLAYTVSQFVTVRLAADANDFVNLPPQAGAHYHF